MNEEVRWKYSKNRKNIFSEGFACKNLLLFQFWNNKENAWNFIHVQKIFVQKFEQISQIRDNNLTRENTMKNRICKFRRGNKRTRIKTTLLFYAINSKKRIRKRLSAIFQKKKTYTNLLYRGSERMKNSSTENFTETSPIRIIELQSEE